MKTSTSEGKHGIQWTSKMQLDDLDFADDLALLSQAQQQMQEKTTSVAAASAAVGLNIHKRKSRILRYKASCTNPITIDGEDLEDVKTFTYLGSTIDEHGGSDADLKARIDYVKYTNLVCGKGRKFRKTIHEDIKNSITSRRPNPVHTQGYADNSLRSCDAVHENVHTFGHCLSCFKFHSFNPCQFRHYKCVKCGDMGLIQSVCNTNVQLTVTNIKSCNSDSIKSSIYDDHLSLSTILKDSVELYNSSELSETQNLCETTVSSRSTYHISHVIVPDKVFPNDSLISDEIPYADFSNDPLLCNDILDKFEETISEESNLDVISSSICPHNAFVSCEKRVQCEAQVLNELDFDYNSDDFTSTAVYPYHKNTFNVYSSQCEKYVLNEATSFITWGYNDPALFRGRG
ncbi:unnamed protein product [Schistosoma curassoni]|uniref:Phorbol-ester/DAG-type domain-containing protein n=1 Tax=Schistosoma curassoni TaxID=6186 RepID=A0A183KRN7_9TREM|nr:unnamed protein product [Schistosoma curassoni]